MIVANVILVAIFFLKGGMFYLGGAQLNRKKRKEKAGEGVRAESKRGKCESVVEMKRL